MNIQHDVTYITVGPTFFLLHEMNSGLKLYVQAFEHGRIKSFGKDMNRSATVNHTMDDS